MATKSRGVARIKVQINTLQEKIYYCVRISLPRADKVIFMTCCLQTQEILRGFEATASAAYRT